MYFSSHRGRNSHIHLREHIYLDNVNYFHDLELSCLHVLCCVSCSLDTMWPLSIVQVWLLKGKVSEHKIFLIFFFSYTVFYFLTILTWQCSLMNSYKIIYELLRLMSFASMLFCLNILPYCYLDKSHKGYKLSLCTLFRFFC